MKGLNRSMLGNAAFRRIILFVALIAVVWVSWRVSSPSEEGAKLVDKSTATPMRGTINRTVDPVALPTLQLDWPARTRQQKEVLNAFEMTPKNAPLAPTPPKLSSPPVVPVTPVFEYKFIGRLSGINGNHIFLTDAKDTLIRAKVGQQLTGGWVLSGIEDKKLVFRHSDSGLEKTIGTGTLQ